MLQQLFIALVGMSQARSESLESLMKNIIRGDKQEVHRGASRNLLDDGHAVPDPELTPAQQQQLAADHAVLKAQVREAQKDYNRKCSDACSTECEAGNPFDHPMEHLEEDYMAARVQNAKDALAELCHSGTEAAISACDPLIDAGVISDTKPWIKADTNRRCASISDAVHAHEDSAVAYHISTVSVQACGDFCRNPDCSDGSIVKTGDADVVSDILAGVQYFCKDYAWSVGSGPVQMLPAPPVTIFNRNPIDGDCRCHKRTAMCPDSAPVENGWDLYEFRDI